MFDPELPGVFRNAFVYALAELPCPGRAVEAGEFAAEFDAVHHARAGLDRFIGGWCRTAGIVGHCLPSEALHFRRYRKQGEIPSRDVRGDRNRVVAVVES